jgi:hypothetical protein
MDRALEKQSSIVFHEPSKLLIISGPDNAIKAAQKTIGALLPSYRDLSQKMPDTTPGFSSFPDRPKGKVVDDLPAPKTKRPSVTPRAIPLNR